MKILHLLVIILAALAVVINTSEMSAFAYDVSHNSNIVAIDYGSPLKQFQSGINASDIKCNQGFQLILKSEDGSPACVKPQTVQKLVERGWATVITNPSDNSITKTPYNGIDKPSGIILLGNQTYYMTTFNGTMYSIPSSGTNISFHDVLFTLLRPHESNANGYLYVVDVKFTNDNTNESLVIYPVGVGAVQADMVLSKHLHPQAGFVVYQYNTIKLLVSTGNQTTGSIQLPSSFTPCDTPYPQSNTGFAVLYMHVNSIGKICVRYSNLDDTPYPIGITIFDANNMHQNAIGITTWNDSGNNTISKGNSTITYWIKTGNQTGFYGLAFYCGDWNPFVVGYDNNSNMTAKDFPFLSEPPPCPFEPYHLHIDSLTGIGVKHIS